MEQQTSKTWFAAFAGRNVLFLRLLLYRNALWKYRFCKYEFYRTIYVLLVRNESHAIHKLASQAWAVMFIPSWTISGHSMGNCFAILGAPWSCKLWEGLTWSLNAVGPKSQLVLFPDELAVEKVCFWTKCTEDQVYWGPTVIWDQLW